MYERMNDFSIEGKYSMGTLMKLTHPGNSLVVEIKEKIKPISQKTLSDARLSNPRG